MAERVNPAEIRIALTFGVARPVLVIWVDEEQDTCLVAAITRSKLIEPRYKLAPKDALTITGSVTTSVCRYRLSQLATQPARATLSRSKFDRIVAWLRAEIDL